ncbi:DUF397 domain-containing protein [Flindersiella endophytica]
MNEGAGWTRAAAGRGGWANTVGWRKSSASATGTNTCVEVGRVREGFAVRDSTDPTGPTLRFSSFEWASFADAVKHGTL